MPAIVEAIYVSRHKGGEIESRPEVELVAGAGIVDDRYCLPEPRRGEAAMNNLTLIDAAHLDEFIAAHDAELSYGDFRRNVVTRGIDLNPLVGREFFIGNVLCRGTELCEPCATLARGVHRAILPDLVHKAGIRAEILTGGSIATGMKIGHTN